MNTTLAEIRKYSPCSDGWTKLLKHLGKTRADREPLTIVEILDVNGIDDALWCLRAVIGHDREIRLLAVWCARQVQHLMTDPRSVAALDAAERYANGNASKDEMDAALVNAWDATYAAWDAAARDAAARDAASDARDAAWAAASRAAWAAWAAHAAAWTAASDATHAVAHVARDAARAAAVRDAAWDAQEKKLRAVCAGIAERETA